MKSRHGNRESTIEDDTTSKGELELESRASLNSEADNLDRKDLVETQLSYADRQSITEDDNKSKVDRDDPQALAKCEVGKIAARRQELRRKQRGHE